MIVQCQQCDTKFSLDEANVPAEGAWVRCSKCQEVFQVMPPGAAPPPAAQDDILDLDHLPPPGAAEGADFGLDLEGDSGAAAKAGGRGKGFKIVFWLLAVLVLLPVLVLGSLVGLDRLNLAPKLVEKFRGLPGISILLSKTGAAQGPAAPAVPDTTGLTLAQVRGYFRVNQQAGRIFVIQGLVENHQQQQRSGILVRGKLNDEQGAAVRQAVVYAGPVFNPDELRQLSLEEIQARLGQPTGSDGAKYQVPPAGNIPFMIVFGSLPDNLSHFTAEVVGSEPPAPAAPAAPSAPAVR
jgi:predicted Zn finger-like uncharacterized protein